MKLFGIPEAFHPMPAPPPVLQNPGAAGTSDPAIIKIVPIQVFSGDIAIAPGTDVTIDATLQFGDRCTGLVIQGVVGLVLISINGSALRTIISDIAINDASIRQVRVNAVAAGATVNIQLHGG